MRAPRSALAKRWSALAACATALAVAAACGRHEEQLSKRTSSDRAGSALVDGTLAVTFNAPSGMGSAVAFGNGGYLVAYEKGGAIWAQVASLGSPNGTPFQVSDGASPGNSPAVAFDGTSFVVVWRGSSSGQIFIRLATATAASGAVQTVAASGALSAPTVVARAPQYVVAYHSAANAVRVAGLSVSKGAWTAPSVLDVTGAGTSGSWVPALATSGTGYELFCADTAVAVRRLTLKGNGSWNPAGAAVVVSTTTPTGGPRVAWSATAASYLVAWPTSAGVQARIVSGTPAAVGTEFTLAAGVAEARPAATGSGWVAAWRGSADLRGARVTTSGVVAGDASGFWIAPLATGDRLDGAAADATGNFLVTTTLASGVSGRIGPALPHTLTVALSSATHGAGTVSSSEPALADALDGTGATSVSHLLAAGTSLALVASTSTTDRFDGFTGDCAGATCAGLVMSVDRNVTAAFTALYDVAVSRSGTGTGTLAVQGASEGTTKLAEGSTFTVTANPTQGSSYAFTVTPAGSCSISGNVATCTVPTPSAGAPRRTQSVDVDFVYIAPKTGTVSIAPPTGGTVASGDGRLNCGATCSVSYDLGSTVQLTAAAADVYHQFDGWTAGPCQGSAVASCTVTVVQETTYSVAAQFSPKTAPVTVTKAGAGTGDVTSSPAGLACMDAQGCTTQSANFAIGAANTVTLTATGTNGSTFQGWSGACGGTTPCTLALDSTASRSVTATFAAAPPPQRNLAVALAGAGSGTVTADRSDLNGTIISCGPTCSGTFREGDVVVLTAAPVAGTSSFAGWVGCTSSSGTSCTVQLGATDVAVTATFDELSATLSVAPLPVGGTVTGPAGLACGSGGTSCSASISVGDVSLSAVPDAGYRFVAWGGACSGTATSCTVALSAAGATAFAEFARTTYQLDVGLSGTGAGSVTSAPSGIGCAVNGGQQSGTCSASYVSGEVVTLTAAPVSGSSWTWSGACAGSAPTCTVTMSAAASVGVSFLAQPTDPVPTGTEVVVRVMGTTGNVSGGEIDCQSNAGTCGAAVPANAPITLSATPVNGSQFVSWSGAPGCGTAPSCTFTPSGDTVVSATFSVAPVPVPSQVSVVLREFNAGKVTGGAIACTANAGTCAATLGVGETVTLEADASWPMTGGRFLGWAGCTSSPTTTTCVVTPTSDTLVVAMFAPPAAPPPPVSGLQVVLREFGPVAPVKIGTVTSACVGNAGDCGIDALQKGDQVTLVASPAGTVVLDHWSGCVPSTTDPLVCTVEVSSSSVVGVFFVDGSGPLPPPATYTILLREFGLVGNVKSTGAVTGGDIDCTGNAGACGATVPRDATLTLTASPADPAQVITWAGCNGQPDQHALTCTVPADGTRLVTVSFEAPVAVPVVGP